jgi:hypothetical protein
VRALALVLFCGSVWAVPPITQEEAIAFHLAGRCQMVEPGTGITRPDGKGWITSLLPGKHVIKTGRMSMVIDFEPGRAYKITAPGGQVEWCPEFIPPGRDACGPVPPAFLYNAVTVNDRR